MEIKNKNVITEKPATALARGWIKVLPFLAWSGTFLVLYLTSFHHYLLFHSLAEIFSVVIACGIFMFVWNSRKFLDNNYFIFIGIAYLFIAFIDTLHTLAYKGMDIFQGYDSDLATQLWIQARFIQSMALVIAPLYLKKKIKLHYVFVILTSVVTLLLASVFYWKNFPTCFIEGQGLTHFKIFSEYFISGILFLAILLLTKKKAYFDSKVFKLLIASISVTIFSEVCFSHYVSIYGLFNLTGHFLKIIAFYLIYKATIEIGLTKPYELIFRNLKISEQKLFEEKNKAQTYLDIAGVIMVVIDNKQKVTLINKKGCDILGYEAPEVIGKNWFDSFVPQSVREETRQVFLDLISGKIEPNEYFENSILTKDSNERLIAWHNKILRDEKGKCIATLSSGEDITERKQFELTLKESEERFRVAVDNYPSIFVIYDSEQRIRFMNAYGVRIYGISKEKIIGHRCEEIHATQVSSTFLPVLKKVFETKTTHTVECPMYFSSGTFTFVMTYVPMLDEKGEIKQVLGISYDVTERKLAEDALKKIRSELEVTVAKRTAELRETNEILEKILSSTHFCIVYLDPHFNFIRVNKAYADSCGYPIEHFIGKNHFDLYPDEENQNIFEKVVKTGESFSIYAKPFAFPDHPEWGVTYWDWSLLPVKDSSGRVEGLVFCLVDVTKRKLAEEELFETQKKLDEAQRLSDIGTLAATVAHELRNPLASIHMTAFNMLRKAKNSSLKKYFDLIEKKIDESDQIINNLLFYSRIKPPKYEKVNIFNIIKECLSIAKSRYSTESIEIAEKIKPISKIIIGGDPLQLKEVFSNIINNAYDALWNRKGRISIMGNIDDVYINIQVEDTGPGIEEDVLKNIFNPFFTTKAQGTGLGLTVSKQIIDLHGGMIEVKSQKGQGTRFSIKLPINKKHE